jgi:hypothetical protein
MRKVASSQSTSASALVRHRSRPRCRPGPRCRVRTHHFELRHHPVVLVLHHVAMEHVHADVIGELEFDLEYLTGRKVPGLLHGFVWIAWSSVATDALL